ncbi:MAG: hypothetical protein PHT96_08995 [Syntrophorhabdaceae bacterium]|nr:hypothetical protein [Syntrophorhabdaceae bacterium]MDD4196531.1 hypothetical protein [Syntrophorhabdaceae bacterium]HOC45408.1 hypothetical protein [Syntrophorhabdaceae bacterium]
MWKTVRSGIGIITISFFLLSCTTYALYSRNFLAGKDLFNAGRYDEAQKCFQDAQRIQKDAAVFTYLAATAYKKGHFESAADLIDQAEKSPLDRLSYLRMYGYKVLILLSTDHALGLKALDDYIKRYSFDYPLESIQDVKAMRQSGMIDKARLEALIEDQARWYEKEMELYIYDNVGFYSRDKSARF